MAHPVPAKSLWPRVVQIKGLSKKLSVHLSKTVDSCESFFLENASVFDDISEVADTRSPTLVIKITLKELKLLEKTLASLAEKCDDFNRNVGRLISIPLAPGSSGILLLTDRSLRAARSLPEFRNHRGGAIVGHADGKFTVLSRMQSTKRLTMF